MADWKIRTAKNKKPKESKLAGLADKAYKAGSKLGSGPRSGIGAAKAFVGGVMGVERAGPKDVMGKNKKAPAASSKINIKPGKKKKGKTHADWFKNIPKGY
jgi:hypothetical protein